MRSMYTRHAFTRNFKRVFPSTIIHQLKPIALWILIRGVIYFIPSTYSIEIINFVFLIIGRSDTYKKKLPIDIQIYRDQGRGSHKVDASPQLTLDCKRCYSFEGQRGTESGKKNPEAKSLRILLNDPFVLESFLPD